MPDSINSLIKQTACPANGRQAVVRSFRLSDVAFRKRRFGSGYPCDNDDRPDKRCATSCCTRGFAFRTGTGDTYCCCCDSSPVHGNFGDNRRRGSGKSGSNLDWNTSHPRFVHTLAVAEHPRTLKVGRKGRQQPRLAELGEALEILPKQVPTQRKEQRCVLFPSACRRPNIENIRQNWPNRHSESSLGPPRSDANAWAIPAR